MPRPILLFDVNETLLDTHALSPDILRILGPGATVREWFTEVLLHALALNAAGDYRPLDEVAENVLRMSAAGRHRALADDDVHAVAHKLESLPSYPDVKPALGRLKDAGFRMATLSNSSKGALAAQIENARLGEYFDRNISVDSVRKFKPAPEPYHAAAGALGVDPGRGIMMVAAHGWDVYGALRAGLRAAFIARPGKGVIPVGPQPEIATADLGEFAEKLIAQS
jgi:2-haloacid dehalogenase